MKWKFLGEINNNTGKSVKDSNMITVVVVLINILAAKTRLTFALNCRLNSVEVNDVEMRKDVF